MTLDQVHLIRHYTWLPPDYQLGFLVWAYTRGRDLCLESLDSPIVRLVAPERVCEQLNLLTSGFEPLSQGAPIPKWRLIQFTHSLPIFIYKINVFFQFQWLIGTNIITYNMVYRWLTDIGKILIYWISIGCFVIIFYIKINESRKRDW
jgi:hypothetical protein